MITTTKTTATVGQHMHDSVRRFACACAYIVAEYHIVTTFTILFIGRIEYLCVFQLN